MAECSDLDQIAAGNVIHIENPPAKQEPDSNNFTKTQNEMEGKNSAKSNIYAQDIGYKSVTQGNTHDSNLPKFSDLCDRNMVPDSSGNDDLIATQQWNQEVVYTNADNNAKSDSRDMPFIAETTSSHSNAGDSSHLEHNQQEAAGQIDQLHHPKLEADNNDKDSNDLTDGPNKDGKTVGSTQLTEQEVLHKLQDAAVEKQFQFLTNIRDISQSNLSMLSRMNKADASVKRLLARPRLTAKEVKDIYIDTDIEATVNEFLQTNMVGNFVMVRVLQENYCRFYSWLTAHLQIERDSWVARLKQALEKIEVDRKDCLVMKDVLATSTSRLHQLIQQLSVVMMETSRGTEVNNDKSPLSGTLHSSNVKVFHCDNSACFQPGHEPAKESSDTIKDPAHQRRSNKHVSSLSEISGVCSEHLDMTSISNTEGISTSDPLACQTHGDTCAHGCCEDLAKSRAHSISSCSIKQNPASCHNKGETASCNNKGETESSLQDEKCTNIGRTLSSLDKEEADNFENDEVDLSQTIGDRINVLGMLCEELVRDHLACFRLLGVCPGPCQSLLDALYASMRDKGHSVHIKLKEVEKRVGSLEIENRHLVEEVKSLYNSLTQKTNEVSNLHGQVEILEFELRRVGPRVAVSERLGINNLAVNSPEIKSSQINKLHINSYQISRHARHNNQLNRRYSYHMSDTKSVSDGLCVASSKPTMSRPSLEKYNQGKHVELSMAQSSKPIQGELITYRNKECNGRDTSCTTTETPCWPSGGKTLGEIGKQGQKKLQLRANEGSISDEVQAAGTDLADKREPQSKTFVEGRVETFPLTCIIHKKKLIDTHTNPHRQYTRHPKSDQGCIDSPSTSNNRIGQTVGHEDLSQLTSRPEQDGSRSSRRHEHNPRPATARCISPNDIPNPCNSPESTESVSVTNPLLKPDHEEQHHSNINRVSMYTNNDQSTDDYISKKHENCETRNIKSSDSTESEAITKPTSTPSREKQLNCSEAVRKNNDYRTDIGVCITDSGKHNQKYVIHSNLVSLISRQMSESMPVLSRPRQRRKPDVSKCLRCQHLFCSTDNQKLACRYHRWGQTRVQQNGQGGKMVQVTNQWMCCTDNDAGGCSHGKHI